jgi:hypothetical protein
MSPNYLNPIVIERVDSFEFENYSKVLPPLTEYLSEFSSILEEDEDDES